MVLVDDSIIIAHIIASNDYFDSAANWATRLAFHNLQGDQIGEQKLEFPYPYNSTMIWSTYGKTVVKINNKRYITGGWNFDLTRLPGYNISSAFWYIFDQKGDSIKFDYWEDPAMNQVHVKCIATHQGKTILCLKLDGYNGPTPPYIGDFMGTKIRLVKLDEQGEVLWNKQIDPCTVDDLNAEVMSLRISPEGDKYYLFQTRADSFPKIIVVDSSGEYLFQKEIRPINNHLDGKPYHIQTSGFQYIRGAVSPTGSLYYIKTECEPFVLDTGDTTFYTNVLHYGKLTSNGDTLWRKTYDVSNTDGYEFRIDMYQVEVAANGDVHIVAPYSRYLGAEDSKVLYLVTDSNGVVKRARNYRRFHQSFTNYYLTALDFARDGKVVMGGGIHFPELPASTITDSMRLRLNGRSASWLIMVDSLGRRCEGDTVLWDHVPDCLVQPGVLGIEQTAPSTIGVAIYPNPVSKSLTIALEMLRGDDKLQLSMVDMQGRVIHQRPLTHLQTTIDCSQLATGMYAIQIYDASGIRYSGKVVKR